MLSESDLEELWISMKLLKKEKEYLMVIFRKYNSFTYNNVIYIYKLV